MSLERGLDFFEVDLLPTEVDALRAPAEQRHRPVLFQAGEIAGYRIALAVDLDERRRGLDRVLVVAERHVAAPRHASDLTGLDRTVVVVEDDRVGTHVHVDETALVRSSALLEQT